MIERHLPYFAVVAEEQHYQRAADRLGVTQSALSRRIQVFEHELGFKLFERTARGAKLTPAGQSLYEDIRRLRRDLLRATDRARSISRGELGILTIAVNPSASSSPLVIRMFQIFRARNPEIDLNLEILYSEEQVNALHTGAIDMGLLYRFREAGGLTYSGISRDRLQLILARSHPLVARERLCVADLRDHGFVWPRRSHSPHLSDWMIAACHEAGLSPRICMEVQSVESVINIVAIGPMIGFAMQYQADHLPAHVVARQVDGLVLEIPLSLAHRSDRHSVFAPNLLAALDEARRDLATPST